MKKSLMSAFLLPVAGVSLASCGVNSVPTAEEEAKARWADVQTELQRRSDLVPNLVATVKAAASQERDVLREVTEARASANQIQVTGEQLTDPQAMARLAEAQSRLTISLQRLQEAYPELKTNQNFLGLQDQLEGTENRIGRRREQYNEAVQAYNTRIRTFPDVIGAKVFYGAKPMAPFEAAASAQQAPKVDFGGNAS
ncbi:LemA family protein [Sphingosinicella sp. BN140058]|uniref:LemA family protein n=1 Tax=Sphingosinicella sp. BN140058 TaxID=1892855 RepID=UPI0010114D1B|nr:LemA family protein [Sphingosinicella sp. BN140058]QAY76800.1 LemA family protein [Sphingosinicella sp. BN140058]